MQEVLKQSPMMSVQRVSRASVLGGLICLLLPLAALADEVKVQPKSEAPAELQALFANQDDTESRQAQPGLRLPRRTVQPSKGIEQGLRAQEIDAKRPALVLMRLDRFPAAEEWTQWASQGLEFVQCLKNRYWLVRLTIGAEQAADLTGATSLAGYRPTDKVDPRLDQMQDPEFFDAEQHLVVVNVRLVPSVKAEVGEELRRQFHRDDVQHVASMDPREVTLVTHPSTIERLREEPDVVSIRPGLWQAELLMDGVRAVARGETVLGGDGKRLTGYGIRVATNEALGFNWVGKTHDAFWNHDAAGNKTTPRLTPLANSGDCLESFNSAHNQHGLMTAGVLIGNGWHSGTYIEDPVGFRGIASGAVLDCYEESGAHAHVSSHSYTNGPPNDTVLGMATAEKHHAHVVALGNSGRDEGYYSVKNAQKNLLGVGNAQVDGEIHARSSAGPTSDGRIKPDLAAPTGNKNSTIVGGGFSVEIHRVRLIRQGQTLFDWNFLLSTPEGWGQTASDIGYGGVEVTPQQGWILVAVDETVPGETWGTWGNSPVVGTEVDAQGVPLNFVGKKEDVLRVDYRAEGLDYFDLIPTWFRDHPHAEPNCTSNNPGDPTVCARASRGVHGGIAIGDGQLRTMEIPIGLAGEWFMPGNPYWDDLLTWAEEPIQFLGLRFWSNRKEPTPSYSQYYTQTSSGTSGASPVLGGGYALAMENLTRLYDDVDLDARWTRSVYYQNVGTQHSYGMPLNSTWKALFIHTADDMIRTEDQPTEAPPNPDTGVPNVYHRGSDYTTGYGMVDIQSAIDLMNQDQKGKVMFDIVEFGMSQGMWHSYPLTVPDDYAMGEGGLKVTLVWDDAPSSGELCNNLGLALRSPDGTLHYPWSLDVPPAPAPAASDIVPARRDQPNDRDNVEQVVVDDVPYKQSGTWRIMVSDNGMGDSQFPQQYSLVISPWSVEGQCHTCP